MLFSKSAVRKAVLQRVEDKIQNAEEMFEDGLQRINNQAAASIRSIIEVSETQKEGLLEDCVSSVIE